MNIVQNSYLRNIKNLAIKSGLLTLLVLHQVPVFAVRYPRPSAFDDRIKVMVYHPEDVFRFTGHYGYQTAVVLAEDEEVASIAMGDTTSWQIVPQGNRILIKPIEKDATTNMTLITNKREYLFELYAEEAIDINDPAMSFKISFLYPDEEEREYRKNNTSSAAEIDLSHPEKYNFNYSISGNEEIAPVKIFDDGEFTYLQFRDKNAELPAIFAVDENLRESTVNYHLSTDGKNLVVVEQVFKKLSIRHGNKIACVFNEIFKPY